MGLCSGTTLSPTKDTVALLAVHRSASRSGKRGRRILGSHLARRADDRDLGVDPNEEGSDKVDAESFSDDKSTAHHDSADAHRDNGVKLCHRGDHYLQTGKWVSTGVALSLLFAFLFGLSRFRTFLVTDKSLPLNPAQRSSARGR